MWAGPQSSPHLRTCEGREILRNRKGLGLLGTPHHPFFLAAFEPPGFRSGFLVWLAPSWIFGLGLVSHWLAARGLAAHFGAAAIR